MSDTRVRRLKSCDIVPAGLYHRQHQVNSNPAQFKAENTGYNAVTFLCIDNLGESFHRLSIHRLGLDSLTASFAQSVDWRVGCLRYLSVCCERHLRPDWP